VVAFLEATHKADFVTADAHSSERDSKKRINRKTSTKKGGVFTFYDARLLIDRVDDTSSQEDVESITAVLKNASAAGDRDAKQYLKSTWPKLREVLLRRVSRRRT
jgi:hypothetical protein